MSILLLALLSVSGCASSMVRNPGNLCDIFEQKRSWYKAAVQAEKKWGTSLTIPMAIMHQESSFRSRARPPRRWYMGFIPGRRKSTAYGYAQVIDGTWDAYIRATGDYWRSRNKFGDALDFIHWYLRQAQLKNGVSRNDPYHLYLNYHEGTAGFRRGSYTKKPGLLRVARRVQQQDSNYARQYAGCRKSLSRGWFSRWLGF